MITVWDEGNVAVLSATDPFGVTVVHRVSEPGVLEQHLTRLNRMLLTPNGKPDFMALLNDLPIVRFGMLGDGLTVVTTEGDVLRLRQVSGWGGFDDQTVQKLASILGRHTKTPLEKLSDQLTVEFGLPLLVSFDEEGRFKITSPSRKLTDVERQQIRTSYILWKEKQK
jgi:hypothetical protein